MIFDIFGILFQYCSPTAFSLCSHPCTHFIHYKIHPSHTYGLFCGPSASWS